VRDPLQIIYPTTNATGPVPSRQDRSYSHHVILDPSRKFLLIPDLGADLIRVFKYHPETVAPLTELPPLVADPGAGPRHGVFWTPGKSSGKAEGEWYLLFNGELSQKVYSYRISYTSSGLSWDKVFEGPALGDDLGGKLPATTAPTSGIVVSVSQSPLRILFKHKKA
jgi:6-phosphogluconolactonase (cycloisomerase 2 family)